MSLSNFIDTKPIGGFFVEKKMGSDSDLDDENPPCRSKEGKLKICKNNLTQSMTFFCH